MKEVALITVVLASLVMVGWPLVSVCRSAPVEAPALTHSGLYNAARVERAPDYTLLLESRRFVPGPGMAEDLTSAAEVGVRQHVIVQFLDIPGPSDVSLLKSRGIELLDYLPNRAYFAGVPTAEVAGLSDLPGVRSVQAVRPEDKISDQLKDRISGKVVRDGVRMSGVVVVLFGDVSVGEFQAVLAGYGAVTAVRSEEHTLEMYAAEDRISDLAGLDAVQWIEPAPPPKQGLLDDVRATVGADSVQAPPYSLNGSGVALGMWDGGSPAATHEDFAGRLTIPDGAVTSTHATTVAGIMAGDGSRSEACGGTPYQWRGISPAADIIAYDWPYTLADLRGETSEAIGTYGIISSSNSWGWYVCGSQCSYFGTYDDWSKVYDNIVLGSRGAPISVVFGAGNDQDCIECQDSLPDFPYGTVAGPGATAKNTIAVGATNALDKTMTNFSSWGPTKDGRVKPDLVAPGCKPTGGIMGPVPPNDYGDPECGTSYATPVVSGSLGILRQQFDLLGYGDIMPHTLKAILIETAEDLGSPGPDYVFGHGNLRLKDAVDLVIANHPSNELVRVDSVIHAEEDVYYMDVGSGAGAFRVTLVWDDYKGTPGAAKALVNDLDLLLQSPTGTWYYAYKPDPSHPSVPATTGYNDLDNVEVVEVVDPEVGRWTIRVEGTLVPEAPQQYTLVLPFEYPSGGVGGRGESSPEFRLFASSPNPFSNVTSIMFDLPYPAVVTLRIYDARGRCVETLIDGALKPAGTNMAYWDAVGGSGRVVSPGIYFCRMEAGGRVDTQRMIFLR
jgi:hypothetical protein